jgi:hypothetical protein
MVRIPPWRSNLWGPWPPGDSGSDLISEEQIRPLAERLSKQRPWLSAEENWLAAERALRQKPWRPWVICFSGEKERSGWDWADLLLKVSVPVLILGLSTAYSVISSSRQEKLTIAERERQEKIIQEQRESDVITDFFRGMQPLMLDEHLKKSAADAEARGVARGLTLAALSQVQDPERKRLIVSFLLDSGLNAKPGNLFSLSEANLSGAKLYGINLRESDLRGSNLIGANLFGTELSRSNLFYANLSRAMLVEADLSRAYLRKANLSGAILVNANLKEADLQDLTWDKETKWPEPSFFEGAKNIPNALKKQLEL